MGDIESIRSELKRIRENHIDHIEADIRDINCNVTKLETGQAVQGNDLKWLKKFFFIVASASIGSLIAALINLI